MEQSYKPNEAELIELRNIKIAHAIILNRVEEAINQIVTDNSIIFRRKPESRIKKTDSILKNFDKRDDTTMKFIEYVKNMDDIAGLRLAITTKDEFKIAKQILKNSSLLKKFGELDTESRVENQIMLNRGYAAHHYYLKYNFKIKNENDFAFDLTNEVLKKYSVNREELKDIYGITIEVQVRTLAQDLWAVFEHPERYKGNGVVTKAKDIELKNYADLMEVADGIAQLTKNRKIYEAEEYFNSKQTAPVGNKTFLEFEKMQDYVNEKLRQEEKLGSVSTFELCNLYMQLGDYGIFTLEDMDSLFSNAEYNSVIDAAFIEKGLIKKEVRKSLSDTFQLFFSCWISEKEIEKLKRSYGEQSENCKKEYRKRSKNISDKIDDLISENSISEIISNYEVKKE